MSAGSDRAACPRCGGILEFDTDGEGTVSSACPTCQKAERQAADLARLQSRRQVYVGDLGGWLRRYRTAKRLTAEGLGQQCGLTDMTIRNLEQGGARPRALTRQKLATTLGIEIVDHEIIAAVPKPETAVMRTREAIVTGRLRSRLIGALTSLEEQLQVLHSVVAELV